ncbi:MAG: hypothetical protein IKE58_02755 [Blautia sp.]|nr:hypothetical protein [Blautia sp.]
MTDFSQLLLYLPGILIFLVGSGQVRDWLKARRPGAYCKAKVIDCSHIVKKDKKDREIYNFYDILVEYTEADSGRRIRKNIKSPTEYSLSQMVKVYTDSEGKAALVDGEEEPVFHPVVFMLGGALLILLALEQNRGNEIMAMACLSMILIGAGLSMVFHFISVNKRHLMPIDAKVVDIYSRQISKETKILRGSRFTYYPIVSYEWEGRENRRRCKINASQEKAFQVGDTMKLYVDPASGIVSEKNARPFMAGVGAFLAVSGLLAGISILSQVL